MRVRTESQDVESMWKVGMRSLDDSLNGETECGVSVES